MKEEILKALEFEKSKRDIIKQAQKRSDEWAEEVSKAPMIDERKYAWEIELENYRKQKLKEKFWTIGACSGILALILTLLLNFSTIKGFLM